jgi:uncharacterized ferritin-like protein (DUF455 family)
MNHLEATPPDAGTTPKSSPRPTPPPGTLFPPPGSPTPNWKPFRLVPRGKRGEASRALTTPEGIGDRLRSAAFAELQAREAFLWAADRFAGLQDTPAGLTDAWRALAREENKHLGWLLQRMEDLQQTPEARGVSDFLWVSLIHCKTAVEFARFMASAEERGRVAGESFYASLKDSDPTSAALFQTIAREEVSHIELAERFFPSASA